ncbi:hypothetical protein ONZ45_g5832 [Pleurotus djamor]|nr:hypothetical protein ONZ45_g5832 [Pleurotus djamor]
MSLPLPDTLTLEASPSARNKAVATRQLQAGEVIFTESTLATVLYEKEKGHRCDACLVLREKLQRCSGCASYFYCDAVCQKSHWPSHKRICKRWNKFVASSPYQALHAHERLDSVLLSHFIAVASLDEKEDHLISALNTFKTLLPAPSSSPLPPTCPSQVGDEVKESWIRFGNNNFTIHSHLNSFAHGIFPLASRLFNHSCVPNAAARYKLSGAQPVIMEVVALRDVAIGEEVCIPYLDPALLQTRQQVFQLTYGFHCKCLSCLWYGSIGTLPDLPEDSNQLAVLEQELRHFVGLDRPVDHVPTQGLPPQLFCFLKEEFLEQLSSTFSQASHDGPHDLALSSGSTLLALYLLIYPMNYPQIGMHALELAKTAWNATISTSEDSANVMLAKKFLSFSRRILKIYGREGDPGGPLDEIDILEGLLNEA